MFLAAGAHLWPELLEEMRPSQNPWEIRARCKIFHFTGTFPPSLNGRINKHRSAQAGVRGGLGGLPRADLRALPARRGEGQSRVPHQQQQTQASQRCTEAELLAGKLPPGRLSPLPVRGCSSAAVWRRGGGPPRGAPAVPGSR